MLWSPGLLLDLVAWEGGVTRASAAKILAGNLGMEAEAKTSPQGVVVCGTLWSMC